MEFRIGQGYDIHALVPNRLLLLGGVVVPHTSGCLGHSDADVLLHSICDAILGAAHLGSIGELFPNTQAQWKNLNSQKICEVCLQLLQENSWCINNLDATIVLQQPKLQAHLPTIEQKVAKIFHLTETQVSIKVKSKEYLGATGQGLAVEVHSVVLLKSA